jgi:hypothetical protein
MPSRVAQLTTVSYSFHQWHGSMKPTGVGSRQPPKKESKEEYEQRLRRSHEEQLTAQERRKHGSISRKERQAREREQGTRRRSAAIDITN